jgi:hypothetical protein
MLCSKSPFGHLVAGAGRQRTLVLQWRIDDREALLVLLEGDVGPALQGPRINDRTPF